MPLGVAAFGAPPETSGRVYVPTNDPGLGNPGYMVVTATPTTIYVAFDISPSAKFSYATLLPPNEGTGVIAPDPTVFTLLPANAGHTTVFAGNAPVASPTFPLAPTVNTVTVIADQVSGISALQNDKNVAMVRLKLHTDRNTAIVQRLRVQRTGSASSLDSDITAIKVWQDLNGNGLFDSADSTRGRQRRFPGPALVRQRHVQQRHGHDSPQKPILVGTAETDYFVTYDISQFAAHGKHGGHQGRGRQRLDAPGSRTSSPSRALRSSRTRGWRSLRSPRT